jgi:hypothetical protein
MAKVRYKESHSPTRMPEKSTMCMKVSKGTGKFFRLEDEDKVLDYAKSAFDASRHMDESCKVRMKTKFTKSNW